MKSCVLWQYAFLPGLCGIIGEGLRPVHGGIKCEVGKHMRPLATQTLTSIYQGQALNAYFCLPVCLCAVPTCNVCLFVGMYVCMYVCTCI